MQDNFLEYKTKPGTSKKKLCETVSACLMNQILAQEYPRRLSDDALLNAIQIRIRQDIIMNGEFRGIMLVGCWESVEEMERIYNLLENVYGLKVDDKCNMKKGGYRVSFRINSDGMDMNRLNEFMKINFI